MQLEYSYSEGVIKNGIFNSRTLYGRLGQLIVITLLIMVHSLACTSSESDDQSVIGDTDGGALDASENGLKADPFECTCMCVGKPTALSFLRVLNFEDCNIDFCNTGASRYHTTPVEWISASYLDPEIADGGEAGISTN